MWDVQTIQDTFIEHKIMKKNKENREKLESNDKLTLLVREKDIEYWEDLLIFIRDLPYGRNTNREDLGLVMKEFRGTCSSKHAFLKEIVDRNGIENIKFFPNLLIVFKTKSILL